MDSRGNISFVFIFVFLAIVIVFMFAFLSPALQIFTEKIYLAGEPMLIDANTIAGEIQDSQVQTSIRNSLQASKDTTSTQIETLNFFYQYAWVFVLALVSLVLLLFSRFLVERQVGGAV